MTLPRLFSILLAAAVPWLVIGVRTGASGRVFPDVFTRVGVLTDQLPNAMTDAQVRFAATHFVGSQKLTPDTSGRLRAVIRLRRGDTPNREQHSGGQRCDARCKSVRHDRIPCR